MKRSESQSLYNALPGAYITYTSSAKDSLKHKAADKTVLKIGYWKVKPIEKFKNRVSFYRICKGTRDLRD